MQSQNISDVIEQYLKRILAEVQQVEIKRSEIAAHFNCVPSQINYVIKTRFTLENGYLVQSKRGGGGYIRIAKVNLISDAAVFDELLATVAGAVPNKQAMALLQALVADGWLTKSQAQLLAACVTDEALSLVPAATRDEVRGKILTSMLHRLKYQE